MPLRPSRNWIFWYTGIPPNPLWLCRVEIRNKNSKISCCPIAFFYFFFVISKIIITFVPSLVSPARVSGRSYIWERRFRTSVVVDYELRKLVQIPQQADDNRDVYVERIYIPCYYIVRSGVGWWALSILCGKGNAKACSPRMGKRTDTYAFFVYLLTWNRSEMAEFGVLGGNGRIMKISATGIYTNTSNNNY